MSTSEKSPDVVSNTRQGLKDEAECKSQYSGRDFYEVLGVGPAATLHDIQRAYRALALKVHPDRNGNSRQSTRDFQELGRMMEILSDPQRRASYDSLGDVSDDAPTSGCRWEEVFRRVTEQDIDAYAAKYIGSDEERKDVLHYYNRFEGDLNKMLEWIPLSHPDYLPRYCKMIESFVSRNKTKQFPKWKEALKDADNHRAKYEGEAKEAEQLKRQAIAKYLPFLPPAHPHSLLPPPPLHAPLSNHPKPTPPPQSLPKPFGSRKSQDAQPLSKSRGNDCQGPGQDVKRNSIPIRSSTSANEDTDDRPELIENRSLQRPNRHEQENDEDGCGSSMTRFDEGDTLLGSALAAGMRAREIARHREMVRSMEQRFGKRHRPTRGGQDNLPSEAEFARIQQRLDRNRARKRANTAPPTQHKSFRK